MADWLSSSLRARIAPFLFITSSTLVLIALLFPAPPGGNRAAITVVAVIGVAVGVFGWFAPWERWPRWASLSLPLVAFLLVAVGNSFWAATNYTYGFFYGL